ncbi:GMP synthase (glutamine-hydrolyzing) [Gordonibacter sp. An230]|uniref:GMP synthase (glutamine-hydrolyzing) n=1 Tax=Gordonibacter sp. An230 TaxID=1965592 RepID=UPI001EF63F51|nr:hypothetical protein [Gordonibacter sp. An230]
MFEEEARKVAGEVGFLAQGTIYPDILESDGVKAHHSVGGLPDDLRFELVEPVKLLYKDEVRVIGRELGLPEGMVERQPFPGPGLGVRAYEWPAVIRAVNTVDAMTAEVPELDWALLKKITARILAEVPGICRVVHDLTPKPIGTIEWE